MGEVWLARDGLLGREVAIKLLSSTWSAEARLRFQVEARALARLRHANVVSVHHAGEADGRPYLVTERLMGAPLSELAVPVSEERALALALGIARALVAAHRAGVLHRDVKPANVFLCDDGAVKLLDFGLAKLGTRDDALLADDPSVGAPPKGDEALDLSRRQAVLGTPLYAAPEVWRGEPATERSDVYSFGVVLYELMAGRVPVEAASLLALQRGVLSGAHPALLEVAPAVRPAVSALVESCLALSPQGRPSSDALVDSLAALLPTGSASAAVPGFGEGDPGGNPYRGLLAFDLIHHGLFFGRDAEVTAVIEELRRAPVVTLLGPSGQGKSSVARAGVMAHALRGALGPQMAAVVMVPGEAPRESLARALAPLAAKPASDVQAMLEEDGAALAAFLGRGGRQALLVVDQLEELVTLAPGEEREPFADALRQLTARGSLRVLFTLRSDCISIFDEVRGLAALDALRSVVVLAPLSKEGLRRAVTEPAARRGYRFEPVDLPERFVAAAEPAALPLLEFALAEVWDGRDEGRRVLSGAALEAGGGIAGALARHADRVLSGLDAAVQGHARQILLELVTPEGMRRRRAEDELVGPGARAGARGGAPPSRSDPSGPRRALAALVEGRLVVAAEAERGASYAIAHEALVRDWSTLRGWIADERQTRERVELLRRATAEWVRLGRPRDGLLRPQQLRELEPLLEGARGDDAGGDARAPRAAALGEADRELLLASRAWERRRRAQRALAFVVLGLLVVAIAGGARLAERRATRARVAEALARAARAVARANAEEGRALALRRDAFALYDRDDWQPAEGRWKEYLAAEDRVQALRHEAEERTDAALALDASSAAARALAADQTVARFFAAERLHRETLARSLRGRLALYDDGSRAAQLDAPGHVRVETDPPGASLTLARFQEDGAERLVEADRAPFAAGEARALPQGSYLIVAEAPGRFTTRYPFLVRRGEDARLRIVLPLASAVPEGMVYVPGGRTLYGSRDDEETRSFFGHQPAREVEVGPFFIARTEVTNGEYIAFLSALPEPERNARRPTRLILLPGGRVAWDHQGRRYGPGEPYCNGVEPCVDWSRLPVSDASEEDGAAYAAWSSKAGRAPGARLCTDREWERAARGADGRAYPHGNAAPTATEACTLATYGGDGRRAGPCAAGSHSSSRSPFGVDDLVGSLWEATASPADIALPGQGLTRGGSWNEFGSLLVTTNRGLASVRARYLTLGVRLCADVR